MIPLGPLANHLWQSTVFAGVAGLLCLALRQNHARMRHRLWLAASLKFLIPFSVLTAVGSRCEFLTAGTAAGRATRPVVTAVVAQISQPFTAATIRAAAAPSAFAHSPALLLPVFLGIIWIWGFVALVFCWGERWRRITQAVRAAAPLSVEAPIPVLSSPAMLEPGVFGIFRPVLLLPEGILDSLSTEHIQAILAHEMCHVRRRDNLAAALHMAVEALFWFHPLVWWIGARLVEERERACDEEVLLSGSQPDVYAESILKTCQYYLESPLVCMSGIAGSDLKKRITRIMTQRLANRLSAGRKLLLAAAGIAAIGGPIAFGLLNAPQSRAQSPGQNTMPWSSFDVVSIKPSNTSRGPNSLFRISAEPGRFTASNTTLKFLLQYAYHLKKNQIAGGPSWIDSDHFDVEAKTDETNIVERKSGLDDRDAQLALAVQAMLTDRFKLVLHHKSKEMPIYALVVAKSGPKLQPSAVVTTDTELPGPPPPPDAPQPRHSIRMTGRGSISVVAQDLDRFADLLSNQLGVFVVNRTGLTGDFDFTLNWAPGDHERGLPGPPPEETAPQSDAGPSIYTALQEQLGLKLEATKGPVDTIVIDHVEKPSGN